MAHPMEYDSAIKRNEALTRATMWMNPEKHHAERKKPDAKRHRAYDYIYMKHKIGKSIETESRLVVARGWRGGMGSDG